MFICISGHVRFDAYLQGTNALEVSFIYHIFNRDEPELESSLGSSVKKSSYVKFVLQTIKYLLSFNSYNWFNCSIFNSLN
jgi:hypothetical protein